MPLPSSSQFGSRGQAALVVALLSLGSMVGGLILSLRTPGTIIARYRLWLLLVGVLALPLLAARSIPSALLLAALAGLPWAPLMACQYTLISITAPRGTMTEAFTWNTAAFVIGIAAGSICAGPLVGRVGANTSVLVVGAAVTLALVLQATSRPYERELDTALEAEHGR
jgi:predicted MFS family arabinose efflux permease